MSLDAWVRERERPQVRLAEDWCDRVMQQGYWQLTDFLTPRERYLTKSVALNRGLLVQENGGYAAAERVRMLIMPDDWQTQAEDFEIVCLEVTTLADVLRHRDVQGSILGLGLQRKAIGDIAVMANHAYVFATKQMGRFIHEQLHHVGRQPVSVAILSESPDLSAPAYVLKDISVASLRLDAVLAQAGQLSRSRAQQAIEHGDVSINFATATSKDELAVGDILSLRGFGRIKVFELMGTTRRERLRLKVGILRSNT